MEAIQVSIDRWMGKEEGCICLMCMCVCVCVCVSAVDGMEYNSLLKIENLDIMTTWMVLEGIMLSEISQTEKGQYYVISLTCRI